MNKVHLLAIDCQKDFVHPDGALYVKGAENDMDRLALMVKRLKNKLDDIHLTLDSHHLFHIANPGWWQDSNGKHPNPFTQISVKDVESGTWMSTVPSLNDHALKYVKALEAGKKYALTIWPPHCLIGSEGHSLHANLLEAVNDWETLPSVADMVTKGSNPLVEHYSALKSEMTLADDPTTQLNTALVKTLMEADIVAIAGEALSHCVKATVEDVANNFGDDSYIQKLVFLKDASSSVTGFESFGTQFLKDMVARGMKVSTTKEFLA